MLQLPYESHSQSSSLPYGEAGGGGETEDEEEDEALGDEDWPSLLSPTP